MKWDEISERSNMVFYFTATGNSLYIAKKISKNPKSIPQVIKQENLIFTADKIGIVCPVYCGEIPGFVLEFIKTAKFDAQYLYLILTYGNDETDSAEFTYNQCKQIGVTFDYIHCVKMVDNYLPVFDMNEQKAIDKHVDAQLKTVINDINALKKEIPAATTEGRKLHARVAKMNKIMPSLNNGKALKIDASKCTRCKICAQVCPIGNISVKATAERRSKKCEFCLACVQNCPYNAIRLKMDKNPNARYRNENVTLQEIIEANHQR